MTVSTLGAHDELGGDCRTPRPSGDRDDLRFDCDAGKQSEQAYEPLADASRPRHSPPSA
jgi:hypothetical protein